MWIASFVVSLALAVYSLRKKSLDMSGAIAAFLVGLVTFEGGIFFWYTLLFFFFSSSRLTKYKAELKKDLEDGYSEHQGRDWKQVFANGGLATLLCYVFQLYFDNVVLMNQSKLKIFLSIAFISIYCCDCGDTWSSELGILSKSQPIHVLTCKTVPHGTNGGISVLGTLASALAGVFYGIFLYLYLYIVDTQFDAIKCLNVFLITVTASTGGSLLDSVIGAVFEYSGYCTEKKKIVKVKTSTTTHISGMDLLEGNGVNFVSNAITGIVMGLIATQLF